jgi:hypothetical protein
MKRFFTFLLLSFVAVVANAQVPFTAGNIVVLRVGDGTNALSNKGNALFLDEYNPTTKTKVQSIALPTAVNGANQPIVLSGTATSEGALARSANGQFLTIAGYSSAVGVSTVSLSTTTGTVVPRVVAIVKNDASINTAKTLTNYASANNPRGAYSNDGNSVWLVSGTKGLQYSTINSTDSAILVSNKVSTGATISNLRTVAEYSGQLFVSTGSGSSVRIGAVGTGLPTDTGKLITPVPGLPIASPASPYAFYAAKVPSSIPIENVLYVADDNTNGAGGIKKYALNILTSSWDSVGVIDAGSVYRGLTGVVNGSSVILYATRNSDSLVTITDNAAYNAAPSSNTYDVIAAAPSGTAFRGVALTPVSAPLAINGLQLTLEPKNGSVNLSWSIDNISEANNFVIEKSSNGNDFSDLKTVTPTQNKNYTFTDKQVNNAIAYYRIKVTKKDGNKFYSNVAVLKQNIDQSIKLYPNPAKDFVVVETKVHSQTIELEMLNSIGRSISKIIVPANQTMVYIPINNLAKGSYFISYKIGDTKFIEQFVK